ncbi:MAG: alpha-fucosidase, partial [Oscillospiraceae bacterium]|nr:alpha-fucosidase [Oscillospiraceae bacterium]
NYSEFYIADGGNTAEITAEWSAPVSVGSIVMKENILCGQRVESFTVEAELDGGYTEVYRGTVIGYKRIVPLENVLTRRIRIKITDSRTEPTLAFLGIYKGKEVLA